jgi:hypothetical protein
MKKKIVVAAIFSSWLWLSNDNVSASLDECRTAESTTYRYICPPENLVSKLDMNADENNLIIQADGDGGDTAQREGMYGFAMALYGLRQAEFKSVVNQLEVLPGLYVRHPYQSGDNSKIADFSRDQQRPIVAAIGAYSLSDKLDSMVYSHASRLGKYQNKDIIGPVNIGEYIRAYRARPLYPVLLLTDTALLIGSIGTVIVSRFDPEDVDDNNHIVSLLQAQYFMPTPIGWLARKIYVTFRPQNYGNKILKEKSAVVGAMAWYHRKDTGGNPAIVELYRPLIEKM